MVGRDEVQLNTYSFCASIIMRTLSLVLATVGGAPMISRKVGIDILIDWVWVDSLKCLLTGLVGGFDY